jgi:hypothetical protein
VNTRRSGIAWRLLVPLLLDALLVVAHWLVADALDRAGLVERLLSPSGLDAVVALLAALVLFGLRFAVFFVAPALTLAWWVAVLVAQLARRADARLEDARE